MTDENPVADQVIDAAMRLAATRPWQDVRLSDIASEAQVSLAKLSAAARSKADVLRLFARRTDKALLASLEANPVEGTPHDRLFDIIMRRFDLLAPHRAALRSIVRSPVEGLEDAGLLLGSLLQSQRWLLAAANLDDAGTAGAVRRLGLAALNARVMHVWVDDEEAGQARTMAALDRGLRRGGEWLKRLDTPLGLASACIGLLRNLAHSRSRSAKGGGAASQGNRS